MAVGDSDNTYDDEFHMEAADWIIPPDVDKAMEKKPADIMEKAPEKQMEKFRNELLPGTPIADKRFYDKEKGYTDFFNGVMRNPNADGFISPPSESDRGVNGYDYDYKSFYADNPNAQMTPGQHYPDTYKKPNHPTFSEESRYHGTMGYLHPDTGEPVKPEGGRWEKLDNGKYSFTPGRSNLEFHTPQELLDYFKRHEPDATLILPGQ